MVSNHFHPQKKNMFQQDCYDHVPVDDVYNEDVVVGFHGVQAEILRKVHDEFQNMKICMATIFRSFGESMNLEITRNTRVGAKKTGDGSGTSYSPVRAGLPYTILSIDQSKISPPKC